MSTLVSIDISAVNSSLPSPEVKPHGVKVIGCGTFCKVLLFRSRAVKVVSNSKYSPLLVNEYRVLKKLVGCRNIVRALKLKTICDTSMLVLEYGGMDLFDAPAPTCTAEKFHIYRQVSCAVEFMHTRDIVHLDIKMENVVIDSSGRVRVIDFGFARILQSDEVESRTLRDWKGSTAYCCPEMLRSALYNGFEADSWSLGILVFTMYSRTHPWLRADVDKDRRFARFVQETTSASIAFQKLGILREAPQWVLSVINQTIVVDPDRRRRRWSLVIGEPEITHVPSCMQCEDISMSESRRAQESCISKRVRCVGSTLATSMYTEE